MANKKAALKSIAQTQKRTSRNVAIRSELKTLAKKVIAVAGTDGKIYGVSGGVVGSEQIGTVTSTTLELTAASITFSASSLSTLGQASVLRC